MSSIRAPAPTSLYRATTLGRTLKAALVSMKLDSELDQAAEDNAMLTFDAAITNALATQVTNQMTIQGHLDGYRHCDNVWTLIVKDATFVDNRGAIQVDAVKIVAPEARNITPQPRR